MDEETVGLCADCVHAQDVRSGRGSEFLRCKMSELDGRFPRYPRIPVLDCDGYAQAAAEPGENGTQS